MDPAALSRYLILLTVSPVIVLFLHGLSIRVAHLFKTDFPPQLLAAFVVLMGYPTVAVLAWSSTLRHLWMGLELGIACLYGVLVYGGLSYAYFHLFNMGETARRFRILYELKTRGKMSRDEIDTTYSPKSMLRVRLDRLVAAGQLKRMDGRYMLGSHFLYRVSQILTVWGRILRLPTEGRT